MDDGQREMLLRCVDLPHLRAAFGPLLPGAADLAPGALLDAYLQHAAVTMVSPNPVFDEPWYRDANPDVRAAVAAGHHASGFQHYVLFGLAEGRWPNGTLHSQAALAEPEPPAEVVDEAAYLANFPGAGRFLAAFPVIPLQRYHDLYGRFLGFRAAGPETADERVFAALIAAFDPAFYAAQYLAGGGDEAGDPLSHYLVHGMPAGHAPNALFDEAWYRAFYGEVGRAIARGELICGFHHYIAKGRAEGRLPRADARLALETRIPGVIAPVALHRIAEIEGRMGLHRPAPDVDAALPRRVWFLLPSINPDVTFGGYRAAFELIRAAHRAGYPIGIACTEDAQATAAYFRLREGDAELGSVIGAVPVLNLAAGDAFTVGAEDAFVAYSVWDLHLADRIRAAAPATRVILLAQEFEPIFHEHSSARAILEAAYGIRHFAIVNSRKLEQYFAAHRIGAFAGGAAREGVDYVVFEHLINSLDVAADGAASERRGRVLVAYARPEAHAARNLFEVLVLALRQVCAKGLFGPEWRFVGLGALSALPPVELGGGHALHLQPKMSEPEYLRCMSAMDIGVSLMFAPHPSVMPFEFATTGAIVVTNTFENRSAAELAAICPNIVAGAPSVAGIAAALEEAVRRVPDEAARLAQRLVPETRSWAEIFHPGLLAAALGPLPGDGAGTGTHGG